MVSKGLSVKGSSCAMYLQVYCGFLQSETWQRGKWINPWIWLFGITVGCVLSVSQMKDRNTPFNRFAVIQASVMGSSFVATTAMITVCPSPSLPLLPPFLPSSIPPSLSSFPRPSHPPSHPPSLPPFLPFALNPLTCTHYTHALLQHYYE